MIAFIETEFSLDLEGVYLSLSLRINRQADASRDRVSVRPAITASRSALGNASSSGTTLNWETEGLGRLPSRNLCRIGVNKSGEA